MMARAIEADPQFAPPNRPRFVDGVVVVRAGDRLVVEGTGERQLLRGSAAVALVPRLIETLDGTRDAAAIAAALPDVPAAHLRSAVALLYTCGLLVEGEPAPDVTRATTGPTAEWVAFIGRHLDTTRASRSPDEAVHRLAVARVAVVGDSFLTAAVARYLRDGGVGTVLDALPPDGCDLVVAVHGGAVHGGADDPAAWTRLDDRCAARGTPWLGAALAGRTVTLGPYLDRRFTACYRCAAVDPEPSAGDLTAPSRGDATAFAALAATEALYVLARVGQPATTAGSTARVVLDLDRWTRGHTIVVRRPGCPTCCPLPEIGRPDGPVDTAYLYEQAVAFPPRHLVNPKDHQHHYKPGNVALQRHTKRYPSALQVTLPEPGRTPPEGILAEAMRRPTTPAPATLGLDRLAGLLLRAAGWHTGEHTDRVRRWAPTGGNLGSVQLYVLARRVTGLDRGWYCYQPVEHTLASVASVPVSQAVPPPLTGDPEAVLVLSGALFRVARKYNDFALRIVYLDAGAALAQISVLAHAYGLVAVPAGRWDDEALLECLGLDGDVEPLTAVIGLYREGPAC
jgi:SagB-type dehydrogenase family enzyme